MALKTPTTLNNMFYASYLIFGLYFVIGFYYAKKFTSSPYLFIEKEKLKIEGYSQINIIVAQSIMFCLIVAFWFPLNTIDFFKKIFNEN